MNNLSEPSSFSGSDGYRYDTEDLEAMQEAVNYYGWILDMFRPFMGNRILEVGAGSGNLSSFILQERQEEVYKYLALEPDPGLCQKLYDRLKEFSHTEIKILNAFLSDAYASVKEAKINTVIYVNVLEHVEDDRSELRNVAEVITQGGHILTFTPAMPSLYSDFDRRLGHYRRYTLQQIKSRIEDAGFRIVKAHYADFPGYFLWWLKYRLLKSTSIKKSQVRLFDRLIVPLLRYLEPPRLLPFGKNVVVIGEKM